MRAGAALLVILLLPSAVRAQQGCDILDSRDTQVQNGGTPQEIRYMSFAVLRCEGGRLIRANDLIHSRASGILQLLGDVLIEDSTQTLTGQNVQYFTATRRIVAYTDVVLTHRATSSVIVTDRLEYDEATEARPVSLIRALPVQRNPRAILREAGSPDSTTLDAQMIEIIGEAGLRGTGSAVLVRDSLTAIGNVIDYSREEGRLEVSGAGSRIEQPDQRLYGDSITAVVTGDDEVREVLTRHGARLEAEDMRVTAPAIRLYFENGGVDRMVAMNWAPLPGTSPGERPFVETDEFRMRADSLDVLAPGQRIEEAVAVGNAFGERLSPDSLRALLPEADAELRTLIESDWVQGDTVRALFTDGVRAPEDTTAATRVMERLLAVGEPARSMYRLREEDAAPDTKLSISYMVGNAIEVRFEAGRVTEVFSSPDGAGVFLQPQEAAQRTRTANGGAGGADGR